MFTKVIKDLEFIGADANSIFQNITGDSFGSDRDFSFVATMRALLPKRMAEDDKITFLYRTISQPESTIREYDAHRILDHACSSLMDYNMITLLGVNNRDDGNSLLFEKMDNSSNGMEKRYDVRELKDLRQFVSSKMDARFYINEQRKATIIVVSRPDYRDYHYLQALIPRYLPWCFADKPIDEEEKELLHSLIERYAANYERIIKEFAAKIDFKSYRIKTLLSGFEKKARLGQLRNIESKIQNIRDEIIENARIHERLVRGLDDEIIREYGLKSIIDSASNESELVEYFLCNNSIELCDVEGQMITFYTKCHLDNFDPEGYSAIANNRGSDMYSESWSGRGRLSPDDVKLLFDAILSDEPTLKVKICSYYEIDTRGHVVVRNGWHFPAKYNDYIPNPHIQYHRCLGNYERYIKEALVAGNTIGAVEQCIASSKSINVLEGATFPNFVRDVCNSRRNIIELPDGSHTTPADALVWLKKENTEDVTEEVEDV